MRIDREKVEAFIRNIRENLPNLQQLRRHSFEQFSQNFQIYTSAERLLQITIEDCINIGTHIINRLQLQRPEGYKQVFTTLGDHGVIPKDLVFIMRDMAGFRNLLVHLYWQVELESVYKVLQNNLNDFEKFIAAISDFLLSQQEDNP